jgi:transposase-like protein
MKKLNKKTYRKNTALNEDQFRAKFSTERKSRLYLEKKIWGKKPRCPFCGSTKTAPWNRAGWYRCNVHKCNKPFTIRKGTVLEGSKIPIRKWLLAEYYVVTMRKGISSLELSKKLGLTQKSAWFLLQRIRHALDYGNYQSLLGGLGKIVELDETYGGGRNKNRHADKKVKGSGPAGKAVIFGLRERGGRTKAFLVPNAERETLLEVIKQHVRKKTLLSTDEARQYLDVNRHGYRHRACNHSAKQWVNSKASTNGVENLWSLLKRSFYGIYHKFSIEHLPKYLAESVFRLNEGSCKYLTLQRIDAIVGYCIGKRLTWSQCIRES